MFEISGWPEICLLLHGVSFVDLKILELAEVSHLRGVPLGFAWLLGLGFGAWVEDWVLLD